MLNSLLHVGLPRAFLMIQMEEVLALDKDSGRGDGEK